VKFTDIVADVPSADGSTGPVTPVMTGGSLVTVKVVVQALLLPVSSVAITVMVVVPNPTSVPAAGLWLRDNELSQLSEAITPGSTLGTVA
jgi:hypothetical protein